jgi:hypothetical protein
MYLSKVLMGRFAYFRDKGVMEALLRVAREEKGRQSLQTW